MLRLTTTITIIIVFALHFSKQGYEVLHNENIWNHLSYQTYLDRFCSSSPIILVCDSAIDSCHNCIYNCRTLHYMKVVTILVRCQPKVQIIDRETFCEAAFIFWRKLRDKFRLHLSIKPNITMCQRNLLHFYLRRIG